MARIGPLQEARELVEQTYLFLDEAQDNLGKLEDSLAALLPRDDSETAEGPATDTT